MGALKTRALGKSGIQVTEIGTGLWAAGGEGWGPTDDRAVLDAIDVALDAGVNFLGRANVYSRGRSEEVTRAALKCNGKRQRIVLATKVHGKMADDDPNMAGNSRRHIIEQREAGLHRLQTDYIDLYQIHRPDSTIPIDETLRALDNLIRDAKVRYIGTSTYAAWQVVESLALSKELGLNRFIGPRTMDQLEDNLGTLDVSIDDNDRTTSDELWYRREQWSRHSRRPTSDPIRIASRADTMHRSA